MMDEEARQRVLMSALTTEHLVLQTAASSLNIEASARSSLYMLALSSCLVAIGFTSQSPDVFIPLVASVLPAVFLLGIFTVVRLVDASLEYMQHLKSIARIRNYYRTISPEAAVYFAADNGRWPETKSIPTLRLGALFAYLSTIASMIAFVNNVVAGAGITILASNLLDRDRAWLAPPIGIISVVLLSIAFLIYQRWRFNIFGVNARNDKRRHST
jgi:hypothetical protein